MPDSGIKSSMISAGLTEDNEINAEERQQMASQIPFGRPVLADEIASAVAWSAGVSAVMKDIMFKDDAAGCFLAA